MRESGAPLPHQARAYFEPRLGTGLGGVRVHTGPAAALAAQAVQARAYTTGRDIVFGSGEYAPATARGRRLLAHELVHVIQQRRHPGQTRIMRQLQPAQQSLRPATVREAAEYLEELGSYINSAHMFARVIMAGTPQSPATPAARQRAHNVLNQGRLRTFLTQARQVFDRHAAALEAGSPDGTRLRAALVAVLAAIRRAIPSALAISGGMPAPTPADELAVNSELVVELIEADPFTSAGLAGTPAFGPAETTAAHDHERFLEAYLDDLILSLPGQALAPAARDGILARIGAALRRSLVTAGTGAAGTLDVRAITDPVIVLKYQRVVGLLSAATVNRPPQLRVVTAALPAYVLPDPIPNVQQQLAATDIGAIDVSRVPPGELPSVHYGLFQAGSVVFGPGSTEQRRNSSWPVVFLVRRGGNLQKVRYELLFDNQGNVRVERLGPAEPREVPAAFAELPLAAKKAQLVADFQLSGVDDRPAAGARPAAQWTSAELDQVKAVFDLLPARDRAALRGVALVRDHSGPPMQIASLIEGGFAHTGPDPAHDAPGPPAHGPPHIHLNDAAFARNDFSAIGAPGAAGPGADLAIAHEVGHIRIFLASRDASARVAAAYAQVAAANRLRAQLNARLPPAQRARRNAWGTASSAAHRTVLAFNAAVAANPPAGPANRAQQLQAARAAAAVRDQRRADLAAAGVPQTMVAAANARDAATDALLQASLASVAAAEQIPTFIALAAAFGFTPFTDYAVRGGNDEFFAESYALYINDPNRLNELNRRIFLWFAAGMPMNPAWRPPP